MEDNPFIKIAQTIREDNKARMPVNYRLGNVTSASPLTVEVAGTSQDKNVFLKNDAITSFEIGDLLFLIPIEDEQKYIILCKVVSA